MSDYMPRFAFLKAGQKDVTIRQWRELIDEQRKIDNVKPSQSSQNGIARWSTFVALYTYATGYPVELVREALSVAARAYVKVFERREMGSAYYLRRTFYSKPENQALPLSVTSDVDFMKKHGVKDYSTTASKEGIKAAYVILSAGDMVLAKELAALYWDPHNLEFHPKKAALNLLHYAKALQNLLLGKGSEEVESELAQINIQRKDQVPLRFQREMIRAIAAKSRERFCKALDDLLAWFGPLPEEEWRKEQQACERGSSYVIEPEVYLCLPAVGLSAWAVYQGVVKLDQLPTDNVLLPLELVSGKEG
jgi:hypothetical protein